MDDDLETRFRAAARKKFGDKKGTLKKAIKESVEMWIAAQKMLQREKNIQ